MSGFAAFDRYFRTEAPAERLAALRILIGLFALVYVIARSGHFASYADLPEAQFRPVGIASWLDAPLEAWAVYGVLALCIASGIAFVAGWRFRASGPLFALSFLWVTTYRCSFGMIFHQDNLVALHLVVLALSNAADAWSLDARASEQRASDARYGWPIWSITWITIGSYVLGGVAKLRNGGLEWASGEVLRSHVAYDALRKLELGGIHSPLGAWLVQFSAVFWVLGVLTLVLELGAPLAALGGRIRVLWVVGIWGFHLGVVALMAIGFAYPLSGCAFASFFAVERPLGRLCARFRWKRLRG
jgi:hypothetical protein